MLVVGFKKRKEGKEMMVGEEGAVVFFLALQMLMLTPKRGWVFWLLDFWLMVVAFLCFLFCLLLEPMVWIVQPSIYLPLFCT